MAIRTKRLRNLQLAGALIGALAALFVAGIGHLKLWMASGQVYESTGATQGVDLWTYYSMARAVWRSPNGITYTYPYSLYWPIPPVLFQLPITVLAWVGRLTGLPAAFEIGRVLGAAGAGAAIAAIGALFPRGFWRRWFYVAAVLGGGLFIIGSIVLAIDTAGIDGFTEIHHYQPKSEGRLFWWLPFLVRNLRMPLECIYHALVIGSLACLAWRRYWPAWFLGALTWMSNPFSAVALHTAVIPWYLWRIIETRGTHRRRYAVHLAAWLAVNVAAAIYYGWFLNRWILLRELHALYNVQFVPALEWWRLAMLILPYAAGLLATIVNSPLRRAIWGRPTWRLFAILAVAHIILIQQSAILGERSMQAYHYNRGYLHLALVVLFWRALILVLHHYRCLCLNHTRRAWLPKQIPVKRCRTAAWVLCAIVGISLFDQLLFGVYAINAANGSSLVESEYVNLVRKIPDSAAPALVLTEPVGLPASYVTAFSPHVSWQADETMIIPFWELRKSWLTQAMEGQHGGVAGLGIDYAILYHGNHWIKPLLQQGWKHNADGGQYLVLLKAPAPQPGISPPAPETLIDFPGN